MSNIVRQIAAVTGVRTIVAEQNAVVASLSYYLRDDKWPILAWPSGIKAANQFEFDRAVTAAAAEPILFLSDRSAAEMLTTIYTTVESLPPIDVATGPHSTRRLFAFKVSGVRINPAPITATTH